MGIVIDSQLISSPTLQDLIVSKLGIALSNGIITFYESDMITLKNWYYQSGTGEGPFTYLAGPNPMVLSAAGTFVDVNGNDVIPFWNPWSETDPTISQPYFIKVQDQYGIEEFIRSNFPFGANGNGSGGGGTTGGVQTLDNFVLNNRFWRNIGPTTFNASTLSNNFTTAYNSSGNYYYVTLAPSQNDGFSMPDFNYIKDNNTATEAITFTPFPATAGQTLTNDITPEYYINHTTTVAGTGETLKTYQFPISFHVETLDSVPATFTIQGMTVTGNPTITFSIYQFLGTGVASVSPPVVKGTITLTNTWQKWPLTFTFPSTVGQILSGTGDDALYLQINMPRNTLCNLNFTLPTIVLGSILPTNSFQTYDQIDTIIAKPRTGDVRSSLNNVYYFGWIPMNNGSIGNALSNVAAGASASTRANIDTWPLFNLLWNAVGATNAPLYTSSGVLTSYGASAYADFNANNRIQVTPSLGQVIAGTADNFYGTAPLGLGLGAPTTSVSLTSANMAAHTHTYSLPISVSLNVSAGGFPVNGGALSAPSTGTGNTTAPDSPAALTNPGAPFNVSTYQPTRYLNFFMKL
jgi:hypothetical protein